VHDAYLIRFSSQFFSISLQWSLWRMLRRPRAKYLWCLPFVPTMRAWPRSTQWILSYPWPGFLSVLSHGFDSRRHRFFYSHEPHLCSWIPNLRFPDRWMYVLIVYIVLLLFSLLTVSYLAPRMGFPLTHLWCIGFVCHIPDLSLFILSHKVQSIIQHKVTSIVVVGFIYEWIQYIVPCHGILQLLCLAFLRKRTLRINYQAFVENAFMAKVTNCFCQIVLPISVTDLVGWTIGCDIKKMSGA